MKINDDVLAVLSTLEINADSNAVRITGGHLDRKLYSATNKVLEALGGVWDRRAKAHLFPDDPTGALEATIESGVVSTAQEAGWFPTPPVIAAEVIDRARLARGHLVLEPSAGEGALACTALIVTRKLMCVELDEKRGDLLAKKVGYVAAHHRPCEVEFHYEDFLGMVAHPLCDRVVMNPPFARQQDIDHVTHAVNFLRPGGRLVAVMAAGVLFRQNAKTLRFRELVAAHHGEVHPLPDGAFKAVGTGVRTVLVTLDKPL